MRHGSPLPVAPGAPLPGPRPVVPAVPPQLDGGPYVAPVPRGNGAADTFGAARADVSYHHGDDLFGRHGEPVVAVAGGVVFSVGWNPEGGNRLWLQDRQGNEFYYAHLSAFSTLARDGAHVRAGDVIGFMGETGDAEGTPTHLHFEVHPVSLLALGYDGAIDPTAFLHAWPAPLPALGPIGGWTASQPGLPRGPSPGAVLLAVSDISGPRGLAAG